MVFNARIGIVVATVAVAAGLLATSALAKSNGSTKPGWGIGDENHIHTGPPGQSNRVGPPGHSDRPDDNNHDDGNHDTNHSSDDGGNSGHD